MKLVLSFIVLLVGSSCFSQKTPFLVYEKSSATDVDNIDSVLQFGHKFEVEISSEKDGLWESTELITTWQIGIACPNAFSINMILNNLEIPQGGEMKIRNASNTFVLGPFSNELRHESGVFAVPLIHDDSVIIEFTQPSSLPHAKIEIQQVIYGFRDILLDLNSNLEKDFGDAGSCEINTVCYENEWCSQINSVGMIIKGNERWCSGALITNGNQDNKPYFLTARHCVTDLYPENWLFYFNYQSKECNTNVDGRLIYAVSGASLVVDGKKADYALLELHSDVPYSYNPYFAGWDMGYRRPENGVTIHHPNSDVKKISTYSTKPTRENWDVEFYDDTTTRKVWEVVFSEGSIEFKSSGSALFNEDHLIVGTATGFRNTSPAPCDQDSYYFGRFREAMQQGAREYLDPNNFWGNIIAIAGQSAETCPTDRVLNGRITNGLHSASNNITVNGSTVIQPGQDVEIRAGHRVRLLPGFQSSNFSYTKISIGSCESGCFALKSKEEGARQIAQLGIEK